MQNPTVDMSMDPSATVDAAMATATRETRTLFCASFPLTTLGLAFGLVPLAQAATHTVSTTLDSGAGSLRQAILDANADATTPNMVQFQSGLIGTITLSTGQMKITRAMSVQGPGASAVTVSGNNASRVFYVNLPAIADVTISGLTLTNGKVTGNGGAVDSVGANLTLSNSTINGSVATNNGGGVYAGGAGVNVTISGVSAQNNTARDGGGIRVSPGAGGTGLIENSLVSGNTATTGWGGGLYLNGGSITVNATRVINNHATANPAGGIEAFQTKFTISDSKVSGNTSTGVGGGLYVSYAPMTMQRTVVSGNTASGVGGGLALKNNLYQGTGGATIQNSTFSGNTTPGYGGGIAAFNDGNLSVALTNVTISGNTTTAKGGGLYSSVGYVGAAMPRGTGTLTIESSTIAGNGAATGGGVVAAAKGNNITLHDSIIANNTATTADADVNGTFVANYNFIKDATGATLNGGNNTIGVDPALGPLTVNGGPTPTLLPTLGSPVIDAGDPFFAPPPSTDQRGLPRVAGVHIDIGAVERQTPEDVIFRNGFEGP